MLRRYHGLPTGSIAELLSGLSVLSHTRNFALSEPQFEPAVSLGSRVREAASRSRSQFWVSPNSFRDPMSRRFQAPPSSISKLPKSRALVNAPLFTDSRMRLSTRNMTNDQAKEKRNDPPPHFMQKGNTTPLSDIGKMTLDDWDHEATHNQPHPIWSPNALKTVQRTHYRARRIKDMLAFTAVKMMRFGFDLVSGYSLGLVNERGWIRRIVFLETVAGVPGLVAAMVRHLRSLRRMERDYGWIHTLLEEAENERMHLMTALTLQKPGFLFRSFVLVTQGIFLPVFGLSYLLSPSFAHRFVGYLEEEAVKTYTHLIEKLQAGDLPGLASVECPRIGKQYWQLPEGSTFEDLIYSIRADESHHRDVNHTFANMKKNEPNPFPPGH